MCGGLKRYLSNRDEAACRRSICGKGNSNAQAWPSVHGWIRVTSKTRLTSDCGIRSAACASACAVVRWKPNLESNVRLQHPQGNSSTTRVYCTHRRERADDKTQCRKCSGAAYPKFTLGTVWAQRLEGVCNLNECGNIQSLRLDLGVSENNLRGDLFGSRCRYTSCGWKSNHRNRLSDWNSLGLLARPDSIPAV